MKAHRKLRCGQPDPFGVGLACGLPPHGFGEHEATTRRVILRWPVGYEPVQFEGKPAIPHHMMTLREP